MRPAPIHIALAARCHKLERLGRCFCLGLLILLMLPLPARAADWNALVKWASTADTHVPAQVDALVTDKSAVPVATRVLLASKCHQNMQNYHLELDNPNLSEKRRQELLFLWHKHRNVLDALDGKPENLKKMIDDLKAGTYQAPPRKPPTAANMKDEEKENMEDQLARYRRKVADLKQRADRAFRDYEDSIDSIIEHTDLLCRIEMWTLGKKNQYENAILDCQAAKETDDKAKAYAVAVCDNEKACDRKLKEAAAQAAICRTKADGDMIVALYEEALKISARMEKDLEEVQRAFEVRDQYFQRWKRWKENQKKAEIADQLRQLNDIEPRLRGTLKKAYDLAKSMDACSKEVQDLTGEIRQAELYYVKLFPHAKSQWQALLDDLASSSRNLAPLGTGRDERTRRNDHRLDAISAIKKDLLFLENVIAQLCPLNDLAATIIDQAVASRNAAVWNLAANEHLLAKASQCGQAVTTVPQGPGSLQPPPTPPAPATQPLNPVQLLPGLTDPNSVGGLFIQGPARLISGENTTYRAADGAGNRYTSGITWNVSDETVLVMDPATGQATAFKAGWCTIVVHLMKPGWEYPSKAFFDVVVLARVPDLTGLTGKEALGRLAEKGLKGSLDDPSGKGRVTGQSVAPGTPAGADQIVALTTKAQESLFSTSGGDGASSPGSSGFGTSGGENFPAATGGVDCTALKEEFNAALQAHDSMWAQQVLSRGLFCDFYASAHAQLNELNNSKAQEEEERRRNLCELNELKFNAALNAGNIREAQAVLHEAAGCPFLAQAQAALSDLQRRQDCENLIQQFYAQLQQNNLKGAQGSLDAARQNGCSISQQEIAALQQAGSSAQQQSQQFYNTMQGILQNMPLPHQGNPPPSSSGPSVLPPANPPNLPTINRPGTNVPSPTQNENCRSVCVKKQVRIVNVTDGRHGLCGGKVGKVWTGAIYVTCEQQTECLQWEKRCD
ncbi:MAG: PASTA domain-containing protein [Desulfobacterales bacterium]|nr:PASTA domain-containing protein [Desulfobacterales bacterium]MDD3081309.1 PASTA domain-containing protein [Desulfobacterales bacterium]MDD3950698.1 PASTA domain-containing protein [Desulfobacterales bacterium]